MAVNKTHQEGMVLTREVRARDPKTGGEKGVKPQRLSLVPARALLALSEVYNYGAEKYDDPHNWRRGYPWSWSFDAMQRHALAWWDGEDLDPESGLSHLAHVGWHALTEWTFQNEGLGTDDRPRGV